MEAKKTLYEIWHEEVKTNGWDKFRFRCSMLGKLASKPKTKSPLLYVQELSAKKKVLDADAAPIIAKAIGGGVLTAKEQATIKKAVTCDEQIANYTALLNEPHLSESCKTYLADIYTEVMFDRKDDIKSKYLEKGLLLEEDAITQHSMNTGKMYRKNKQRLHNEFIDGEFDYEDAALQIVKDAKVNWSIIQFNRIASKPIDINYKWQLKGYMWLKDYKKAELVYSLLNTPEHLIVKEERKLKYELPDEADYEAACAELRHNHIYDDIDIKDKERVYNVNHTDEDIEFIKQQIVYARAYLNNFSKIKTKEDGLNDSSDSTEEVDE